jgi:TRAP-type C4-dicarboxylate transport system permease small subunit
LDFLEKISKKLAKILYWVAGTAIVCMMLLTCADVFLRYLVTLYHSTHWEFLTPIPGTYELVFFMASVAVAFAMAHTSVEKGHVAVSFVVNFFPKRAQAIVGTITSSFGFILFALLTWQSVVYAIHLRESQEVSLTLQLPFWPFVHGIAFSAAAVCLVLLVEILQNFVQVLKK